VVVEDLDDDICLYRPDIDEVLVLNASAGDVWRLADGELTVPEIAERLATVYGLAAGSLDADVRSAVDDLEARAYLVERSSTSSAT
jgi:hypothetical protein